MGWDGVMAAADSSQPSLLLHLSLASADLFRCNKFVQNGSKELWKKQGSGSPMH